MALGIALIGTAIAIAILIAGRRNAAKRFEEEVENEIDQIAEFISNLSDEELIAAIAQFS